MSENLELINRRLHADMNALEDEFIAYKKATTTSRVRTLNRQLAQQRRMVEALQRVIANAQIGACAVCHGVKVVILQESSHSCMACDGTGKELLR